MNDSEHVTTVLDSTCCPECGQIIGESNIVHGQRPRRAGVGLTGMAIAMLGAGFSLSLLTGMFSGISAGGSIKSPPPGRHQLAVDSRIQFHHGPWDSTDPKDVLYSEDRKLTGTFEVVAQPPPGYLTIINGPSLAAPIRSSIQPSRFSVASSDRSLLWGRIKLTAVPANIAFEVFVRYGGHESQLSGITCNKGSGADWQVVGRIKGTSAATQPATFDLILRSSEQAARQTVDLQQIWSGELTYPAIPIVVDPSR